MLDEKNGKYFHCASYIEAKPLLCGHCPLAKIEFCSFIENNKHFQHFFFIITLKKIEIDPSIDL